MKTLESKTEKKNIPSIRKTLDNSIPDLSNHPVVIKKVEEAREFLKNHPIPEHLLKR